MLHCLLMRAHVLRAIVALALSAAVLGPYTAPLGCDGDMCCEMPMADHAHHGTEAAVTGGAASIACPMLACGVVTSAVTIEGGAIVPNGAAAADQPPVITLPYTSASLPPHTPPPRV
jgi:hypothetical protein